MNLSAPPTPIAAKSPRSKDSQVIPGCIGALHPLRELGAQIKHLVHPPVRVVRRQLIDCAWRMEFVHCMIDKRAVVMDVIAAKLCQDPLWKEHRDGGSEDDAR